MSVKSKNEGMNRDENIIGFIKTVQKTIQMTEYSDSVQSGKGQFSRTKTGIGKKGFSIRLY